MSKNQQKTTFNDASGLLNSLEGSTASELSTANAGASTAGNAFGALGPSGISNILAPATAASTNVYNTGGYGSDLGTLKNQEQANLSGLDPTSTAKLGAQYQDLISSGGISDATAAAMQRQATSGVSGIYNVLGRNLDRSRAVTGGQGGGGETAQIARQLGQSEANAITGVNAQVGQLRQQGTEAGLAGASGLAAADAAAKDAAARTFSGTQADVAAGTRQGAAQLGALGGETVGGSLASAGGQLGVAGLESNQYQGQLNAQNNLLGLMSGIANNQKGPLQNFEDIYTMYTDSVAKMINAGAGGG